MLCDTTRADFVRDPRHCGKGLKAGLSFSVELFKGLCLPGFEPRIPGFRRFASGTAKLRHKKGLISSGPKHFRMVNSVSELNPTRQEPELVNPQMLLTF